MNLLKSENLEVCRRSCIEPVFVYDPRSFFYLGFSIIGTVKTKHNAELKFDSFSIRC